MSVFEDLVVELQQENLLESTVIDGEELEENSNAFEVTEVPNQNNLTAASDDAVVIERNDEYIESTAPAIVSPIHETDEPNPKPAKKPLSNKEFFRKKAIAEVSSLQMVEHVITGVEREYMKVVPKSFDDFSVKKSLSTFVNMDDAATPEEHAAAELALMKETESWCTALAARDREVPVSALRQYCELSRPALSSQAVLSLGRFYRNLPYSENVRAKFDFVITRLFSRAIGQQKRARLFEHEEMLGHINMLYSEWSSVPLYDADGDGSNVTLTALSFEDLAVEAETADSFDKLIESDFFGRLRMFKESISELFYAPQVTAAAIDTNLRIGNRYVELIDMERQKLDADSVQTKYGDFDDSAVSEVTGKTLQLSKLLRELTHGPEVESQDDSAEEEAEITAEPRSRHSRRQNSELRMRDAVIQEPPLIKQSVPTILRKVKAQILGMNKVVLVFAIVMLTASAGLYIWANFIAGENVPTKGVVTYDIPNGEAKQHIKVAKVSGAIFYVQMQATWDKLPKEKREQLLRDIYKMATNAGCTQATLLGDTGGSVGYISATRLDLPN